MLTERSKASEQESLCNMASVGAKFPPERKTSRGKKPLRTETSDKQKPQSNLTSE